MEYATLNNGVKMPMAGIGTFLLTPDEAEASCVSALQNGYRLIDTANAYVNEKAVGRAMKKSGLQREEIFLETKLWPSFFFRVSIISCAVIVTSVLLSFFLLSSALPPQAARDSVIAPARTRVRSFFIMLFFILVFLQYI